MNNFGSFYLDLWEDEGGSLLEEFEKMLESEDGKYKPKIRKSYINTPDACFHKWEVVGRSPVLDEEWENCAKCGIKREDYEKPTRA